MTWIEEAAQSVRPLSLALAHLMAVCKPGREPQRLELLNRIFGRMNHAAQMQCRGGGGGGGWGGGGRGGAGGGAE